MMQSKKTNKQTVKQTRTKTIKSKRKVPSFNFNSPLLYIILGALLFIGMSYFIFGLWITLILTLGIGAIIGVARLLDKTKGKKKQRRIINICLILCLVIVLAGTVAVGGFFYHVVKSAPEFDVEKLYKKESSILYDINGEVITKIGAQMRENIEYNDLPQVLIDAIIATEDSRFFQHNGFDAPRFIKASIKQLAGDSSAGGASTISMQVIKNSFTSTEDKGFEGIVRKFTDIYLSVFKLEKNYTKEQIIEYYVNNHFLGGNAWGVEQASRYYFNKSVSDLNLAEASIIAGLFKSPKYYNPKLYPEHADSRRATVLNLMVLHGYISQEEADAAKKIPIESLLETTHDDSEEFQGFIDTVVEEMDKKYGVNPYVTPVLIYTTMDRGKQQGVNRVFNGETFSWVDDVIQSGVAVLDVHDGKILAVGAGRHRTGVNGFNFATQMNRQPGSTAKPIFDYGPGIEYNNWSTYTLFKDEPYAYSTGQNINNWDGQFMGTLTLRQSLAYSRNIPALKAFQNVDNKKILEFAQNLGIQPEVSNGYIHEAHALGAFNGVTPLQMSAAYSAFANGGYYNEPYSVTKFVYRDTGEEVEHQAVRRQVMSDYTAYMITDVLLDATSSGVKVPGVNIAAKTGTTNFDDKTAAIKNLPHDAVNDSWTVGYSPDVIIGMWYGYDIATSEHCVRLTPAAIQRDRLFKALGDAVFPRNNATFHKPNSVVEVGVELGTNPALLASPNTPSDQIAYELFKSGTEPTEVSKRYQKLNTPQNLKVNYNATMKKVVLTWNRVSSVVENEDYGPLGYNVYFNDKLLGFTDKNTFTIEKPKEVYGTYKVVATYKNSSALNSDAASYTLADSSGVKYTYHIDKGQDTVTISKGEAFDLNKQVKLYQVDSSGKEKDVTALATITYTIKDGNGAVNEWDTNKQGVYTITYTIKYMNYTSTTNKKVVIN